VESLSRQSDVISGFVVFILFVGVAIAGGFLMPLFLRGFRTLVRPVRRRKRRAPSRPRARRLRHLYKIIYVGLLRARYVFRVNSRTYAVALIALAFVLAGESWIYQSRIDGSPTLAETVIATVPPLVAAVAAVLAAWASVMTARTKKKGGEEASSDDAAGSKKTVFHIESATIVLDSPDNNGRIANSLNKSPLMSGILDSTTELRLPDRRKPENSRLVDDISRLTAMREDGAITRSQFDALVQECIAASAAERVAIKEGPAAPAIKASDGSDEGTKP